MPEQEPIAEDEILDEYSLKGGVPGKYAERYREGVTLPPIASDTPGNCTETVSARRAPRPSER